MLIFFLLDSGTTGPTESEDCGGYDVDFDLDDYLRTPANTLDWSSHPFLLGSRFGTI